MATVASSPAGEKSSSKDQTAASAKESKGLRIEETFCPTDVADPFDTVDWERRSASIKDESGGLLFEQKDCEVPATWSPLATNVVISKYFYGENGTS